MIDHLQCTLHYQPHHYYYPHSAVFQWQCDDDQSPTKWFISSASPLLIYPHSALFQWQCDDRNAFLRWRLASQYVQGTSVLRLGVEL